MNSQTTRDRWWIRGEFDENDPSDWLVESIGGRWVATFPKLVPEAVVQQKADARLLAAAPELLEALVLMEKEKSDYMVKNNLGDPSKEYTNKIARAAIAKATGADS